MLEVEVDDVDPEGNHSIWANGKVNEYSKLMIKSYLVKVNFFRLLAIRPRVASVLRLARDLHFVTFQHF